MPDATGSELEDAQRCEVSHDPHQSASVGAHLARHLDQVAGIVGHRIREIKVHGHVETTRTQVRLGQGHDLDRLTLSHAASMTTTRTRRVRMRAGLSE